MTIAELLVLLWTNLQPVVTIMSYQKGVRWSFGRNPVELGPGVHIRIWPIHEIEAIDAVDTYVELPVQSVITKDFKLVCFSAMIAYRVDDPVSHFCNVVNFMDALEDLSGAHLAQRVRESNYADLTEGSGLKNLETSLKGTLTTRVKEWGSTIVNIGFVNFCEVPYQVRAFGFKDE